MAVISTYKKQESDFKMSAVSAEATVASADSVLLLNLGGAFAHCFLGVQMFDVSGDRIVDSAGTFTVDFLSENSGDPAGSLAASFEDPVSPVIDATAPALVDWQANTIGVRVTAAGLSDTITWKVVFTANRS